MLIMYDLNKLIENINQLFLERGITDIKAFRTVSKARVVSYQIKSHEKGWYHATSESMTNNVLKKHGLERKKLETQCFPTEDKLEKSEISAIPILKKGGDVPKETETPIEKTAQVTAIPDIKGLNPYDVNKAVEAFIDAKGDAPSAYSEQERAFIERFSGYGGLREEMKKAGISWQKKQQYEFYTPDAVVERMVALARMHGFTSGDVLEPAAGIGKFLKYFNPEKDKVVTYEINSYSQKILNILYPMFQHRADSFETMFLGGKRGLTPLKDKEVEQLPKFDLVIGNPPYGRYEDGYSGLEKFGASDFIDYFIARGVDVLKPGGLLVYIVGAEIRNGGTLWLDKKPTWVHKRIADKAELIDAYRLGETVFERTGVVSDILIFKRK